MIKTCTKCGFIGDDVKFRKGKNVCKKCIAEYNKQYCENNKEKYAEYKKKYYENNKERCAEREKQWRENNKERYAERQKQYYENNKEKCSEYKKQNVITINNETFRFNTAPEELKPYINFLIKERTLKNIIKKYKQEKFK